MTTTKLTKKLVMILAIATSGFLLTAIFATPSLFVNAVMQQNMGGKSMMNNGHQMNGVYANNIPQINGTLNLKNNTNGISIKNMSVPFLTAAQSAQNAIINGTIINGHIGITQGYLTYNFAVTNPTNNTLSNVIVDAGNGKVLYTSPGISINSTQFAMNGMKGTNGMNGIASGFGHGGFGHGGFGHGGFGHGGFGHGGFGHGGFGHGGFGHGGFGPNHAW
jgi:hypothetical protein